MVEDAGPKINILLFSALFPHAGEPTLGIFVENRLRHLIHDENVTATVVAPVPWFPFKNKVFGSYARAANAPAKEVRGGITIYHPRYLVIPKIGMWLTPFFLAAAGLRVIRKLISNGLKVDIIDTHYLYPDGVAASRISRKLGIPFVMTARGSDVTQIAHMQIPRHLILKAAKAAGHIITVSQSLKDKLIAHGVEAASITPLRNGVDLQKYKYRPDAREKILGKLDIQPKGPIILFAGWLIQRKRVDIIIDTISQHESAVALLVGDGPKKAELEAQAHDKGIKDRIFFLGQKKPDEMPEYFSAADILILPSEREGWANVLLEAMACGTPVISRAVDGACELVTTKEAGLLVKENQSADAYVDAVNSLIKIKPTREEVRAYAENFDWRATSRGQYEIFSTVITDSAYRRQDKVTVINGPKK